MPQRLERQHSHPGQRQMRRIAADRHALADIRQFQQQSAARRGWHHRGSGLDAAYGCGYRRPAIDDGMFAEQNDLAGSAGLKHHASMVHQRQT
jgi:hypothetical protein